MIDTSSNSIWKNADNYDDWELSRPQIFRDDVRELCFKYYGIKPTDTILDGGCATGVLTRYIAKGLTMGKITGFDISKNFVIYGNHKIADENLSDKAVIVNEDGYNLSFNDNTFDVVVNHTYLGVLSDPMTALKELIRVCKIGGYVSASVSTRGTHVSWQGDYPIKGMERLKELGDKHETIHRKVLSSSVYKQDTYWHGSRYPKLFHECGLVDISIHPIASSFAYDDKQWSDDYRMKKITTDINRSIEVYEECRKNPSFTENGFSDSEYDELIELLKSKQTYLLNNFNTDNSWEWTAGLHYIVKGTKI